MQCLMPCCHSSLGYQHGLQPGVARSVGERERSTLGDGAWVHRPSPQVDGLRFFRLVKVGVDGFEGAIAADEAFRDVSSPGVHWHPVEVESDPEEEGGTLDIAETPTFGEEDFHTGHCGLALLESFCAVMTMLELD